MTTYNDDLALRRAALAATWVDGTVEIRSEQDPAVGDAVQIQDDAQADGLLTELEADDHRLITALNGEIAGTDSTTPPRPQFRRVDIYAVRGDATAATRQPTGELMPRPEQREVLLPGDDAAGAPVAAQRQAAVPHPADDRLGQPDGQRAGRRHPDARRAAPGVAGVGACDPRKSPISGAERCGEHGDDAGVEVFTLIGRWTHDPQSGQTLFTLSWDSSGDPDGLAHLDSRVLAFVLAVGPALIGGIRQRRRPGRRVVGRARRGRARRSVFVSSGTVVLNGIEYQILPLEGGPVQRLVVDYSVEIGFNTALLDRVGINVHTDPDHPMRVRYRNVGLELDLSGVDAVVRDGGARLRRRHPRGRGPRRVDDRRRPR